MVGRQRRDHRGEHRHRRSARGETFQNFLHLGFDHGVLPQAQTELLALGRGRELAVDDEVRGLNKIAVVRQLLDRVTAVAEDAIVAVEEGDLALARAGVAVTLVVGDVAGGGTERARIDRFLAFGADNHGQGVFFIVDFQRCGVGHTGRAKSKLSHWQNKDGRQRKGFAQISAPRPSLKKMSCVGPQPAAATVTKLR